jgi:hypothetical protein
VHTLTLRTATTGLPNYLFYNDWGAGGKINGWDPHLEEVEAGVVGPVLLQHDGKIVDLTEESNRSRDSYPRGTSRWMTRGELECEQLQCYTKAGEKLVNWTTAAMGNTTTAATEEPSRRLPLPVGRPHDVWYRVAIRVTIKPDLAASGVGAGSLALDLAGMGKGMVWVNGHFVGRYWNVTSAHDGSCDRCDYNGSYAPYAKMCRSGCGVAQRYYHCPYEWLVQGSSKTHSPGEMEVEAVVLLFEETGGDPRTVAFAEPSALL